MEDKSKLHFFHPSGNNYEEEQHYSGVESNANPRKNGKNLSVNSNSCFLWFGITMPRD